MELLSDFPKVKCPFVRKTYPVKNNANFKNHGSKLKLRNPEVYLVTPEINEGYEWVFDDKYTIAVEKLDGTNVKIKTENNRLVALQNRMNVIDPFLLLKGKSFIVEGVFTAIQKGYVQNDMEQAGEVIGPKLQGNPYGLLNHIWYPFEKTIKHLKYKSFHQHDRTLENWSVWFKDHLKSLFHTKMVGYDNAEFAEGVILQLEA